MDKQIKNKIIGIIGNHNLNLTESQVEHLARDIQTYFRPLQTEQEMIEKIITNLPKPYNDSSENYEKGEDDMRNEIIEYLKSLK